jgi:hypothetical protein
LNKDTTVETSFSWQSKPGNFSFSQVYLQKEGYKGRLLYLGVGLRIFKDFALRNMMFSAEFGIRAPGK